MLNSGEPSRSGRPHKMNAQDDTENSFWWSQKNYKDLQNVIVKHDLQK